ncbi:hypothetical protein [Micromonospora zhanjiangensis]|uniref:Uncharacterized protein n=1 Tax=Micromonospora zhanjiangensis TaxID=1522057 RepID=A0ABV8KKZ0_9ACTN
MTGGQSQLEHLCEAVQYLGNHTDGLASALHEHARQLAMTAARVTIAGTGNRAAGQAAAAAMDAAARACARAATLLLTGGKLARNYAAANCGGGSRAAVIGKAVVGFAAAEVLRDAARQSAADGIHQEGLDAPAAEFAAKGLLLFPAQVLASIGSVRYAPELREQPNHAAVTRVSASGLPPHIELYGSPAGHAAEGGLLGERVLLLQALIHEVAHVIYRQHLTPAERAQWESICSRSYATGETPMSSYAGTHPREDFAETVVALFARPEWLRATAPQRYAFVEQHFSRLEANEMAHRL